MNFDEGFLAVTGARDCELSPHFEVVLREYLAHSILLLHGGCPHPVDVEGRRIPGRYSIDTWAGEIAGTIEPPRGARAREVRRLVDLRPPRRADPKRTDGQVVPHPDGACGPARVPRWAWHGVVHPRVQGARHRCRSRAEIARRRRLEH